MRSPYVEYALLLEAPTKVYRRELEGHQRERVQTQIRKFVSGEPESAFQSDHKFPTPLRQLKDRGGNVRAFGTWCQAAEFDLLVVQAIYRKRNEAQFLGRQSKFAARGAAHEERFEPMSHDQLRAKVDEWRNRDDLVVVTDRDCSE